MHPSPPFSANSTAVGRGSLCIQPGTVFETIFSHHADTVALGQMAARVGVPHLVLTHLIPPPEPPADVQSFAGDLREGGYEGRITVGDDHTTISF